jgi:hypothetical protein
VARHDVRHLLEAGAEIGRFNATEWLSEIDVPTSVLVTERDRAIPCRHQLALAEDDSAVHACTSSRAAISRSRTPRSATPCAPPSTASRSGVRARLTVTAAAIRA